MNIFFEILILQQILVWAPMAQAQSPQVVEKLNVCARASEGSKKSCDGAIQVAGTAPLAASATMGGGQENAASAQLFGLNEHKSRLYTAATSCSEAWSTCKSKCADELQKLPRLPENTQAADYMNKYWMSCDEHLTKRASMLKAEVANTDAAITQASQSKAASNSLQDGRTFDDGSSQTPAQRGDEIVGERRGFDPRDLKKVGGVFMGGTLKPGHGIAIANTMSGPKVIQVPFAGWGSERAAQDALPAGMRLRSVDWGP